MAKNNPTNIEISDEFKTALTAMSSTSDHLFITGNAGTGKSTLLSYFRKQKAKAIAVLAPTGVAAINVKGETIHSFFRFKPNITPKEAGTLGLRLKNTAMFEHLEAIIIDEISMVRADMIDCIDQFLRCVLHKHEPFGGIQMIWFGDLFQLPPVVTRDERAYFSDVYKTPYFFSAHVVQDVNFDLVTLELTKIYRQQDQNFIAILNAVRTGELTAAQLGVLNKRVMHQLENIDTNSIYLTTTNASSREINAQELTLLRTPEFSHKASFSQRFEPRMAPTEVKLVLKIGAQVMFINNHPYGQWVNGTLGTVVDIRPHELEVVVKTDTGETVAVSPHKWNMHKHTFNPETRALQKVSAGSFMQFPLQLAWAITIHKSQGKTFNSVRIDMGYGAFAEGQTYVALSRCRTLDGIYLKQHLRFSDVIVDPAVVEFSKPQTMSISSSS